MIRPGSRSSSCRRVSKRWQSRGVGPARRKWTMRRPSSVITGIRRAVSGSKEVAKCVAIRSRGQEAWSIEAPFPAVGTKLVRHCHFTGEAPQHSSDPLLEVADSGRVMGENQRKRAGTRGTGAIAPFLSGNPSQELRDHFGTLIVQAGCRLHYAGRLLYADPHPGNYLFRTDGRLGFLDFGCVRPYTDREWECNRLADLAIRGDENDVVRALRASLGLAE